MPEIVPRQHPLLLMKIWLFYKLEKKNANNNYLTKIRYYISEVFYNTNTVNCAKVNKYHCKLQATSEI
jgi:hypothetical protein